MALDEIDKLRQRVEKDPNSRLFLPLAEEYRKSGMLDEAIAVLLNGLERHPGYTSARVALGRIYLDKAMLNEAKAEFESVIGVVPDNLFAHKKLAEIYRDLGETAKAKEAYKAVLALNPLDEDARGSFDDLAGKVMEEPAPAAPPFRGVEEPREVGSLPPVKETAGHDLFGEEEPPGSEEAVAEEMPGVPETPLFDRDFEEFSKSLSDEMTEETLIEEPVPFETEGVEFSEETGEEEVPEEPRPFQEEAIEVPEEIIIEEPGFGDVPGTRETEERKPAVSFDRELSAADGLIASGNYTKAFDVYRKILSQDPQNTTLLQRIAEFRALMKLLGKGEEVLIAKLESFQAGIRERFRSRP